MVNNEDVQREIDDDESVLKDVALVGSDDGRVTATKAILAMRSPVFRRMFYGSFREANTGCDSVKMNHCTPVLRAVVTYCYTGDLELSLLPGDSMPEDEDGVQLSDAKAMALFQVRDAADYLELPNFHEDIVELMAIDFFCLKSTLAIMQGLMIREEMDTKLWSHCMHRVHETHLMDVTSYIAAIRGISFPLLENIIQSYWRDKLFQSMRWRDKMDPSMTILLLHTWDSAHVSATEEERSQLKKLADDIDLESLDSESFVKYAEPGNLFTRERMYNEMVRRYKFSVARLVPSRR